MCLLKIELWQITQKENIFFKSNYQPDTMKQERVLGTHSSKRDVSIKSLSPELRKTWSRGDKKEWKSQRGLRTSGEQGFLNQLSKDHIRDWSSKHRADLSLHEVLCICIIPFSLVFLWHSWVCGSIMWVSESSACSWDSLLSVGLPGPALILYLLFYLIFYFVICGLYLLEVCYFLARDRNRWIQGERMWGRTWEE